MTVLKCLMVVFITLILGTLFLFQTGFIGVALYIILFLMVVLLYFGLVFFIMSDSYQMTINRLIEYTFGEEAELDYVMSELFGDSELDE